MKKILRTAISILILTLCIGASLAAANDVDLSIRLYDQKIYFPGDSISVRLTIHNNSPDIYRFRLANERLHNLDFDVRGMDNIDARLSEHIIKARSSNQRVFYRDIDLLPGEEFSFIEDISNYRTLEDGIYMVHARFFPNLIGPNGQTPLSSNTLTISVREGFRRSDATAIRIEEAMVEEMQIAALPPDEVVRFAIEARMHSNRNQFLQYLDVESLYTDVQQRAERYSRLSATQRRTELEKYRDDLWNEETPEGISLIPLSYQIQQTSYNPSTGSVIVRQKYDLGSYIEIKRFTYELERRDGIWYIVRYQVTNLGTE